MAVRLKGAKIDAIEDAETKRLKILTIISKTAGAKVTLELPEALCGRFKKNDTVDIVIDSKPITKGDAANLYMEGTVFKQRDDKEFEVVCVLGGLRLDLTLSSATPAKKKTFTAEKIFVTLK